MLHFPTGLGDPRHPWNRFCSHFVALGYLLKVVACINCFKMLTFKVGEWSFFLPSYEKSKKY